MATTPRKRMQVKRAATPDERRPFHAHGHVDVHALGEGAAMHGTFEPGWRWSNDVAPIAGTRSCQSPHLGYVLSGRMQVRMDDGQEEEIGPGDFVRIEPGHDAWVIGDEPCVMVDFAATDYAKARTAPVRPSRPGERTSAS